MMTGTDLADDLEAGVHHLLDLGGEVAVAQLTNQRGVLRSRDLLSTNHSSPFQSPAIGFGSNVTMTPCSSATLL